VFTQVEAAGLEKAVQLICPPAHPFHSLNQPGNAVLGTPRTHFFSSALQSTIRPGHSIARDLEPCSYHTDIVSAACLPLLPNTCLNRPMATHNPHHTSVSFHVAQLSSSPSPSWCTYRACCIYLSQRTASNHCQTTPTAATYLRMALVSQHPLRHHRPHYTVP
jgi:hypothetical protein